MEPLSTAKRAAILQCLCEGNSIASTTRITGAAKNTVLDLLARTGIACRSFMDENLVNLPCRHVQLDEIWSFVGHRNRGKEKPDELIHDPKEGDVWTWKALCADTKLLVCFHVGGRTFENATAFCRDVARRFNTPPQISTDGLKSYALAIGFAFGGQDVDYGRIVKLYGKDKDGYDVCVGARKERVYGSPDMERTSTSFIERSNLTLRMHNRRFARKTNAHSKKIDNHCHMLAIHAMNYNFCRRQQGLRMTPAQAAEVDSRQWSFADVATMTDGHFAQEQQNGFEAAFAAMGDTWQKQTA